MEHNATKEPVLTQKNILDNLNQEFGFKNISAKIWDMYLATIDSEYAKEWSDRERHDAADLSKELTVFFTNLHSINSKTRG
jgi:hypothetical protein